jgi:hypothetical protein
MRPQHAFCMLARLHPSCTPRRKRSAWWLALAAVAACEAGTAIDASHAAERDASDATDAPTEARDADRDGDDDTPPAVVDADNEGSAADASFDAADARRFPLCLRLSDPDRPVKLLDYSADVRTGYLRLVAGDCQLANLFPATSAQLAAWSNHLYDWNLDLWECRDRAAAGFALVPSESVDLTSTDAALLIDDYLLVATQALRLSHSEAANMRDDLARLAGPAIHRQSDEHPFADCPDGAADAGAAEADL